MSPERFIELVREDVPDLAQTSADRWHGLCPVHDDHVPSFVVWPEPGYFKCYGCGVGGDVWRYLAVVRHLTKAEAGELLNVDPPALSELLRDDLTPQTFSANVVSTSPRRRLTWSDLDV